MIRKIQAPQRVALSFFLVILIGAVLLKLPLSVNEHYHLSFTDSLFTATSATCVTGLIVKDTAAFFSPFGKAVIFILMQIGGLGIMTFSLFFAIVLGRKLTISTNVVIQRALDQHGVAGLHKLIKYILILTFGVEIIGALLLFVYWTITQNWSFWETLTTSVFHSVSAFCNAGFSLFSNNLSDFRADTYVNAVFMVLIVIGGLGFTVLLDMSKLFSKRNSDKSLSLQTKLVLLTSFSLIFFGMIFIFFSERTHALLGMSLKEGVLASLFQSITARTAGFNTIDVGHLKPSTTCIMIFLMFIGASPGSTGGGIKTCTAAILIVTLVNMIKNKDRVSVFKKTIPHRIVRRAIVVGALSFLWIFLATFLLIFTEQDRLGITHRVFMDTLFEVVSAFGTVGLSTGITSGLSFLGKMIIMITMFVGRVGPLTIALSVAFKEDTSKVRYPEERVMVG
ncbi:MAG: TrkH family potassium uptake protein [Candidatus Omnitrophica bacterium]|nr:TrkH family potassium uptake protein [Candidatus Omnitrophota bacterium]